MKNKKNQLNYYCRSCGYEDTTLTEQGLCVLDTQIQKREQKFNHIVNKYTNWIPHCLRIQYEMSMKRGKQILKILEILKSYTCDTMMIISNIFTFVQRVIIIGRHNRFI